MQPRLAIHAAAGPRLRVLQRSRREAAGAASNAINHSRGHPLTRKEPTKKSTKPSDDASGTGRCIVGAGPVSELQRPQAKRAGERGEPHKRIQAQKSVHTV